MTAQKHGDVRTPLEQWQHMALAENKRAQRNWQGLDNDKPVTLREIRPVAKAKPKESARAKALRKRIQRLHFDGLASDKIAAQLACPEVLVEKYLRGLKTVKPEPPRTKALRMRIQRLHLDGLTPDDITVQLACSEALVWKDLRGLYQDGNKLSDDYRQLRVARIYSLKQQGMALSDIAKRMGFTTVLLNKELREVPQEQAQDVAGHKNMRTQPE